MKVHIFFYLLSGNREGLVRSLCGLMSYSVFRKMKSCLFTFPLPRIGGFLQRPCIWQNHSLLAKHMSVKHFVISSWEKFVLEVLNVGLILPLTVILSCGLPPNQHPSYLWKTPPSLGQIVQDLYSGHPFQQDMSQLCQTKWMGVRGRLRDCVSVMPGESSPPNTERTII